MRGKDVARLSGARVLTTRPVHCRRHFGHFLDDRAPVAPGPAGFRAAHREIECAASRHLIGLGRQRSISWPDSLPTVAPRRPRSFLDPRR
ncbi:hypothetical protein [Burkholderia cenocepacia]|uniref:hypothetical protein n=1 Tax=Burkholderia cenocepacia TaxID=95486 RepID=UPI001CF19064|nr:hypothetical protein [Burkholderia cenocepacia]MCA8235968.1 hypothetical protein [Burkholderia cenocepacia]